MTWANGMRKRMVLFLLRRLAGISATLIWLSNWRPSLCMALILRAVSMWLNISFKDKEPSSCSKLVWRKIYDKCLDPFSCQKSCKARSWSISFLTPDCFRRTCKIHWAKHKFIRSDWIKSCIKDIINTAGAVFLVGIIICSTSVRKVRTSASRSGLCPRGVRNPRGVLSAVAERSVLAGRENLGGMHSAGAGNTRI